MSADTVTTHADVRPEINPACPATRHHTATAAKNYGCRCPAALAARNRQRHRARYAGGTDPFVPAHGVRRRVEALQARGHTRPEIAAAADVTVTSVQLAGVNRRTRASTAHRFTTAYRHLLALPYPTGPAADAQRRRAAAAGYQPPHAWLDGEIDDPDAVGDAGYRRTGHEPVATADIEFLRTPAGGALTIEAIAARLGMTADAVERRLQRRGADKAALTDEQVHTIRAEYERTRTSTWQGKTAAARYGVSPTVISHVLSGKTRPHLGLTDLTAPVQRIEVPYPRAATPGGADRKEATAA